MSQADVDAYFAQVPVWMQNDIRREIRLAEATADPMTRPMLEQLDLLGGGNLLAALGLVSYTEALGGVRIWNRTNPHQRGTPEECFKAFFDEMDGRAYRAWRLAWEAAHPATSLYEALRCGLVHEYQPKVDAAVWIGKGAPLGLDEESGVLIFKVEPYYRHFCAEVGALYDELKALADPQIPLPLFKGIKFPPPTSSSGPSGESGISFPVTHRTS